MCACEPGFVCSRCRETPFERAVEKPPLVTVAQFDELIAENATSEPFDPSRGERWG